MQIPILVILRRVISLRKKSDAVNVKLSVSWKISQLTVIFR